MAYKIIVDPIAGLDIIESIEWYNKAQPGLGMRFYKQVQAVLKLSVKTRLILPYAIKPITRLR